MVLLVLTGPSHAGKTSVARELVARLAPPVAHIEIDEIVAAAGLSALDEWEAHLPKAYDRAAEQARRLLEAGSSVVFESTFTYVPLDGRPPELHFAEVRRLERVAAEAGARFAAARLTADLSELIRRRARTERLDDTVVRGTWDRHRDSTPEWESWLEVTTDDLSPAEVADMIVEALGRTQPARPTT